jgi:flagellar M-ring protein FliF
MVAARTGNEILPPQNLMQIPAVRQLGVMLGIAASVAIGVAVVLWSQTPNYALLYASMAEKEVSEVLDSLNKLNVDYKLDAGSGSVLVPAGRLDELRLKLAGQGLPRGSGTGFELLEKESNFGTSQLVEQARYQRAIEGEIARSITSIQHVRSARVHLALPKQSAFVRKRKKASASVVVKLYSGRQLDKGQVEAIVHLVASSVPQLESSNVTLIDQLGRLLSSESGSSDVFLTSKQFDHKRQVENHLIERIETILMPLVGASGMRAQVSADIDFTVTERTQDSYNPEQPSLRSEQTEEQFSQSSSVQGIPGALSNQPPAAGTAPEVAAASGTEGESAARPLNGTKRATRNFELDKTITHTRLASGEIGRLSVAVVIDDQHFLDKEGTVTHKAYTEEALLRMNALVKQAVGFDALRGDVVTVSNISFKLPEVLEPLPELEIWEQSWFWGVVKQALGGLFALILIFAVLRPTLRSLVSPAEIKTGEKEEDVVLGEDGQPMLPPGSAAADSASSDEESEDELLMLDSPAGYEKRVEFAQKMVDDDPKRVAQVVKGWVTD